MMQVNATRHCCVGGNLVEVPAFAGMTGNLVEVLVPAFAGMTFLRWDDRVVPSFSRRRESA